MEVKATPFKIADDQTPITSIIKQNNFTNESLHVIGQQLDRIEEKIVERTVFLENHYVSNDEVSKQHLNVIKKIKFC